MAILRLAPGVRVDRVVEELVGTGVRCIEFSLVMDSALTDLSGAVGRYGDQVTFGAGTVLDVDQAKAALASGAEFLVSPALDSAVVEWAERHEILHIPGAFSPTEVTTAMSLGSRLIKVFPASGLGPGYLRELLAPLPGARLMPTGGVDLENAADFLAAGAAALGVAGALVGDAKPGEAAARGARFRNLIAATEREEQT